MTPAGRLSVFGLAVATAFAAALLAGRAADPIGLARAEGTAGGDAHSGDMGGRIPPRPAPHYRLELGNPTLTPTEPTALTFTIVSDEGPVRSAELGRTMQAVVVARAGEDVLRLDPTMRSDGTWLTELTLPRAGAYRLLVDFVIAGETHTLGADLVASGAKAHQ